MGALCQELKRYDEALKYRMESVKGHRRVLGNRHRNTLGSVSGLGRLFHQLGRLEEAEPLLLEAATHAERLPAHDPVRTQSIKSMIAFLLDKNASDPQQGYLERAHDWQSKLVKDGDRGGEH
jgi:hypothetical protein